MVVFESVLVSSLPMYVFAGAGGDENSIGEEREREDRKRRKKAEDVAPESKRNTDKEINLKFTRMMKPEGVRPNLVQNIAQTEVKEMVKRDQNQMGKPENVIPNLAQYINQDINRVKVAINNLCDRVINKNEVVCDKLKNDIRCVNNLSISISLRELREYKCKYPCERPMQDEVNQKILDYNNSLDNRPEAGTALKKFIIFGSDKNEYAERTALKIIINAKIEKINNIINADAIEVVDNSEE